MKSRRSTSRPRPASQVTFSPRRIQLQQRPRERNGAGLPYCTNCGMELKGEKFCPECGAPTPYAPVLPAPPGSPGPSTPAVAEPAYPVVPPPGPGVERGARPRPDSGLAGALGIAGVAMMFIAIVGSVLPWATTRSELFSVSVSGLSGDGVITLVAAALGLAAFAGGVLLKTRWPFVVALFLGLVILGVGVFDTVDIAGSVSVGIGLVLCLIAGALGVLIAAGGLIAPRRYARSG